MAKTVLSAAAESRGKYTRGPLTGHCSLQGGRLKCLGQVAAMSTALRASFLQCEQLEEVQERNKTPELKNDKMLRREIRKC